MIPDQVERTRGLFLIRQRRPRMRRVFHRKIRDCTDVIGADDIGRFLVALLSTHASQFDTLERTRLMGLLPQIPWSCYSWAQTRAIAYLAVEDPAHPWRAAE